MNTVLIITSLTLTMQRCSIFHGDETTPNSLIRKVPKSISDIHNRHSGTK